jgi:hypothetical protein
LLEGTSPMAFVPCPRVLCVIDIALSRSHTHALSSPHASLLCGRSVAGLVRLLASAS